MELSYIFFSPQPPHLVHEQKYIPNRPFSSFPPSPDTAATSLESSFAFTDLFSQQPTGALLNTAHAASFPCLKAFQSVTSHQLKMKPQLLPRTRKGSWEPPSPVSSSSCSLRMLQHLLFLFHGHLRGCPCFGAFAQVLPLLETLFPGSWPSGFLIAGVASSFPDHPVLFAGQRPSPCPASSPSQPVAT